MDGKKFRMTQTQKRGILWLSILLAITAAVLLFGLPSRPQQPQQAHEEVAETEIGDFRANQKRYRNADGKPYKTQARHFSRRPRSTWDEPLKASAYDTAARPSGRKQLTVDINTADTLTLQLLHGIGPAYARRIVKYRNSLGGFADTRQLLEVYGFTDELYRHILPHLAISTDSIRQIAVNSVSLKQLIRHPYIDYYQARDLIAIRNRGHRFTCPQDLKLVPTMDDSTINRLAPYLDFDTTVVGGSSKDM